MPFEKGDMSIRVSLRHISIIDSYFSLRHTTIRVSYVSF